MDWAGLSFKNILLWCMCSSDHTRDIFVKQWIFWEPKDTHYCVKDQPWFVASFNSDWSWCMWEYFSLKFEYSCWEHLYACYSDLVICWFKLEIRGGWSLVLSAWWVGFMGIPSQSWNLNKYLHRSFPFLRFHAFCQTQANSHSKGRRNVLAWWQRLVRRNSCRI